MQLHYDVHEGAGEPLLLLHGFLSSRAQWLENIPVLKSFCRVPLTCMLTAGGLVFNTWQIHNKLWQIDMDNKASGRSD